VEEKKRLPRVMDEPARAATMDSAIAAVAASMHNVLMLPHGWHRSFSLRLSSDSASVLVKFSKPEQIGKTIEGKKKKKRSPASRERSAARGRAHRDRSKPQPVTPRQQPNLNPLSPPFVPNSASRVVTTGSERNEGRKRPMEEHRLLDLVQQNQHKPSGPPPPPPNYSGWVKSSLGWRSPGSDQFWMKVKDNTATNKEAVNSATVQMLEGLSRGDQAGVLPLIQVLDSLTACPGFGAKVFDDVLNSIGGSVRR
jgi:hypothetical protein